jgi:hypothetical protein
MPPEPTGQTAQSNSQELRATNDRYPAREEPWSKRKPQREAVVAGIPSIGQGGDRMIVEAPDQAQSMVGRSVEQVEKRPLRRRTWQEIRIEMGEHIPWKSPDPAFPLMFRNETGEREINEFRGRRRC